MDSLQNRKVLNPDPGKELFGPKSPGKTHIIEFGNKIMFITLVASIQSTMLTFEVLFYTIITN